MLLLAKLQTLVLEENLDENNLSAVSFVLLIS
jgi:hypothetical protein